MRSCSSYFKSLIFGPFLLFFFELLVMLGLVLLLEALAFGFDGEGVYELHILVIDRDFHLSPGDLYVGGKA